jgi:uncharacterized membrane protein YadS
VKLTRNLFMAPVIVVLSSWYLRRGQGSGVKGQGKIPLKNAVPAFVLGFVAMAVLNSLGAFPATALELIKAASGWLIVIALAGVGMETNLTSLRTIGFRPFYAGLCAATFMAAVSFSVISLLGIG